KTFGGNIMGIINLNLTYIMCLAQILAPLQITLTPGGEASYFTKWSVNDTFDAADYIELEKDGYIWFFHIPTKYMTT
ncbi:MAG: hypothetical protein IKT81_01960, partial [Clostridia bacterium]|nr:hypothetical protein [Clostridia bacterium]